MKISLWMVCFVLSCASGVLGQVSSNAYMPEMPNSPYQYSSDEIKRANDAAIKAGECLPAEIDTNGNWGPVVNGLQLSIRCQTNVFKVGDSMPLSVIIRNVSTNPIPVARWSSGIEMHMTIEDESGTVKDYPNFSGSFSGYQPLAAMHQIKYDYNLKLFFESEPLEDKRTGVFKIQAIPQGFIDQSTWRIVYNTNYHSAYLTITVLPKEK